MQFYFILLLAFQLKTLYVFSVIDYCAPELCTPGLIHVACKNDLKFQITCPKDAGMIQMTPTLQKFILGIHNEKRNHIAGGNEKKLQPACRMGTMQWDRDLAKLAELNVRKCILGHDLCYNTPNFTDSGQNIVFKTYLKPLKVQEQLKAAFEQWYMEVNAATMKMILDYKEENKKTIGSFTTMMIDDNIRVGCGMAQFSLLEMKFRGLLITCNYAKDNVVGHPTWAPCPNAAADRCEKGKNKAYKNLCKIAEIYKEPDILGKAADIVGKIVSIIPN